VVGGAPWNETFRNYQRSLPVHFVSKALGEDDPLCFDTLDGREIAPRWSNGALISDVSVIARQFVNDTRVILLAGCLTCGVLGAAQVVLDGSRAANNIEFLRELAGVNDFVAVFETERAGNQVHTTNLRTQRPLTVFSRLEKGQPYVVSLDRET
jgi:hypothetical protein